jgi:hypothetical protein
MPPCKRCGNELHGKQESYCSQRCSKLFLKGLYRRRNRTKLNTYNSSWRKAHQENVKQWSLNAYIKKHGHAPLERIRKPKQRRIYLIACLVCPSGYFESIRKRKRCPLHNPYTPAKFRFQILQRDKFRCVYCGRGPEDGVKLHIDHRDPRKLNGASTLSNLVTACFDCNIGKGANPLPKTSSHPHSPEAGVSLSAAETVLETPTRG